MRYLTILTLGALALTATLCAQEINDTRDVLDQWVETRQIISKEKSEWRTEESILRDTKELLSNELERLEASIADLEASATAADEERKTLTTERDALKAASGVVEGNIGALENKMNGILPLLPTSLTDKIKPLIRRLPEDPEATDLSLGERVQNIVGILSQTDKFNNTVTQTSESRELNSGKVVEVRTLYWGLAMAYFVDGTGTYAGIGTPATEGWEWSQIEASGPQIQRLIDVYEGTADIQFVEVPAQIN